MGKIFKRGEVYMMNFRYSEGSIQAGERPCVILQNPLGNVHSRILTIAPLTTVFKELPVHVNVDADGTPSQVLIEQITTVAKTDVDVNKLICMLSDSEMDKIDRAIKLQLWVGYNKKDDEILELYNNIIKLEDMNSKLKSDEINYALAHLKTELLNTGKQDLVRVLGHNAFKVFSNI